MNIMSMSYRDFVWPNNPTSLSVSDESIIEESRLPYKDTVLVSLGKKKRRVSGEGYFSGDDCMERYNALLKIYKRGGAGALRLPGQRPFTAMLEELRLIGVSGKSLVKYAFSFVECPGGEKQAPCGRRAAAAGESLWDYSYKYGVDIDALVGANPHIRDIASLNANEEVFIP